MLTTSPSHTVMCTQLLAEGADAGCLGTSAYPSTPLHAAVRGALSSRPASRHRGAAAGSGRTTSSASWSSSSAARPQDQPPPQIAPPPASLPGGGSGGNVAAWNGVAPEPTDYESTVALLLQAGADPFLEDAQGHSCMDLLAGLGGGGGGASDWIRDLLPGGSSASRRRAQLCRSLSRSLQRPGPAGALFSGMLKLHLKSFGAHDWGLFWVAVLPRRYSRPYGSAPKER